MFSKIFACDFQLKLEILFCLAGSGVSLERSLSAPASSSHNVGAIQQQQQQEGHPPFGRSLSRTEVVKK